MKTKILLVIANYPDIRQKIFDEHYSPRNAAYCRLHGFDYVVSKGSTPFRDNPTWWKFTLVRDLIDSGQLKDGDTLTHLDADMVIVDGSKPYITDRSFSYSIDNGNTHCMGSYTMNINSWSRRLIDLILDEKRYQRFRHTKHWNAFREQASWYSLSGVIPHSYRPFPEMPHYGWHSCPTDDLHFSLDELHRHVEIRGPEWNTTLIESELDSAPVRRALEQYLIVRSRKEDTIIRHFAGGQLWRTEGYTDRPLVDNLSVGGRLNT